MIVYLATVTRRLAGAYSSRPPGDFAYIGPMRSNKRTPVTNELQHLPPVDNNISTYKGTFMSEFMALEAVRTAFPNAVIYGETPLSWRVK